MLSNRKLGVIGGMGSRAGVLLLQKIIEYSPAERDQDFPEIIFHNNSVIPDRTRAIIFNEKSPLSDILRSIELFNNNGIDVIALGCVTSYYYYSHIKNHTCAHVINPLQLIADHIRREHQGARIGLLATTGSIQTGLFHEALGSTLGEIITLGPEDQENLFMKSVYMKNGFKSAKVCDEARNLMNASVERLREMNVNLIVGGCTEVSVAFNAGLMPVTFLDALDLLARKAVEYCYNP